MALVSSAATPDDPQVRGITCRDHVRSPLHWIIAVKLLGTVESLLWQFRTIRLQLSNHAQVAGTYQLLPGLVASPKRSWPHSRHGHV